MSENKVIWPADHSATLVGRDRGGNALSSIAIGLEAWRRGLSVTFTSGDLEHYTVSSPTQSVDFNCSRPESITGPDKYLTLDRKWETNKALRDAQLPVPRAHDIRLGGTSPERLRAIAENLGYPLVLKPNTGSLGRGVRVNLRNWDELWAAYVQVCGSHPPQRGILETFHRGDDYRVLVVGDRLVGAARRVPAHVVGDGRLTVGELIQRKNILRSRNPFLSSGLIKVDDEAQGLLEEQGLTLSSVPYATQIVSLRRVANASAGGDIIDVTDTFPPAISEACIEAVRAIPGVIVAGVDVIYDDTADSSKFVIIEMNARPHIGVNMYPSVGIGRDAPRAIVDVIFPGFPRRVSAELASLRFNVGGVRTALNAGIASRVTLPDLPPHLFPYRQRFLLAADRPLVLAAYRQRQLQKAAHDVEVVGHVRREDERRVEVAVAAENEEAALKFLSRFHDQLGTYVVRSSLWVGPVTTAFTFDV